MQTITPQQAKELINQSKGHIFSVSFIKKDGTLRNMVCRNGVKKGVTGAGMNYNPADHDLLTVYDMAKNEFRSIPLNRLHRVKVDGLERSVE